MAAKNTLSILETIKRKMKKLDKKPEIEDVNLDSDDDFQYISSGKKTDEEETKDESFDLEEKSDKKEADSLPKFEDNLGFEEEEEEIIKEETPIEPVNSEDSESIDSDIDSIDMGEETDLTADAESKDISTESNPPTVQLVLSKVSSSLFQLTPLLSFGSCSAIPVPSSQDCDKGYEPKIYDGESSDVFCSYNLK